MSNVIDLASHRPDIHITLERCDEGHVHVFPESWIRDLIAGKPEAAPLEPCMLRAILGDWMRFLGEQELPWGHP